MQANMKKQLVSFKISTINIVSFAMFFAADIIAVVFQVFFFKDNIFLFRWWDIPIIFVAYIILIIVHEGVHALTILAVGVSPKSVKFGAIPKQMMLYCTTSCPIKAWQYAVVLVMPLIITGIVPLVIATLCLGMPYVLLAAMLVSGAAGDMVMFVKVIRYPANQLVQDHPTAPAFYLLYPEDRLPDGFKEVTEEEENALNNIMYGKRKK